MSPDGRKIVSGFLDSTIKVWDMSSGSLLRTLEDHPDSAYYYGRLDNVLSVCLSPDGSKIVSGCKDSTIKVWDVTSGSLLLTLEEHSNWVTSVCVSPDGRRIVSGSGDKMIKVWNFLEDIWRTYFDPASNSNYYHNRLTGETTWDAPSDEQMRLLVIGGRVEGPQDEGYIPPFR